MPENCKWHETGIWLAEATHYCAGCHSELVEVTPVLRQLHNAYLAIACYDCRPALEAAWRNFVREQQGDRKNG